MLKRLGLGLLKGLLIGGAVGAGLQFGLRWTDASGLLGYLIAMGAAGTAGVFAGKPLWKAGAWIESLLKGMVGVGVGALFYWLSSSYGSFAIPFPGLAAAASWTALPVVFTPLIAGLYGSLVELDNTPDKDKEEGGGGRGPKARVAVDDDEEEEVESASRAKQNRRV